MIRSTPLWAPIKFFIPKKRNSAANKKITNKTLAITAQHKIPANELFYITPSSRAPITYRQWRGVISHTSDMLVPIHMCRRWWPAPAKLMSVSPVQCSYPVLLSWHQHLDQTAPFYFLRLTCLNLDNWAESWVAITCTPLYTSLHLKYPVHH